MKYLIAIFALVMSGQGMVWAFGSGARVVPAADSGQRPAQPAAAAGQMGHEAPPLPSATDYSAQILPEVKGVVSWKTLAQVMPVKQKDRFVPQFSDGVTKLDKQEVRLQGFMMPLDMGEKQKRFILTAVPPSCAFCMPAGPDALVEVEAKSAIKYGFEPIVLSGKFSVLKDNPMGLYYRLTDAVQITAK